MISRRFLLLRTSTALWGFASSYFVTGSLVTSAAVFALQFSGNTVLMWALSR